MKLNKEFVESYAERPVDWGAVGEITFLRTYSRNGEAWFETVERVVNGTYYWQKKHCLENNRPWCDKKAQHSAQEMYELMFSFKFLPPGRGLRNMGCDVLERTGAAANNPLHEDTPVLTVTGWKRIGDLRGERVKLLTSTGDYGSGYDKLSRQNATSTWAWADITDEGEQDSLELTFIDKTNKRTTIVTSKNHRWFRRRHDTEWSRVTAEELQLGDYLPLAQPTRKLKLSDTGVLHGMFFGDGTRSNGELHLFGDKIEVARDHGAVTQHRPDGRVMRQCPLAWGSIPEGSYGLDRRYVLSFLAGYAAADGSFSKNGGVRISSARPVELIQVADLCRFVGIRTYEITKTIEEGAPNNFTDNRKALWELRLCAEDLPEEFFIRTGQPPRGQFKRNWARIIGIKPVGAQPVVCATVPDYGQFVVDGFVLTSNCGFVSTKEDPFDAFCWAMDMLMLGVGVGFDTLGAGESIYEPKYEQTFVIPDTREGWVEALRMLVYGYGCYEDYAYSVEWHFDYSLIRPAGSPIGGFGGVASGPAPLEEMLEGVRAILQARIAAEDNLFNADHDIQKAGYLTSADINDIMALIGRCVVSGGVRRSAEIAFIESDDTFGQSLKNKRLWPEENAQYRWAANHSVKCDVGADYDKILDNTAGVAELGIFWLDNAQDYGRMGRRPDFADKAVLGCNPCAEQSLEHKELCCLVEVFASRIESTYELQKVLKYAYLYAKTVTTIPIHDEHTGAIVNRNRRIGCSLTGIQQAITKFGAAEFYARCNAGYRSLKQLDERYSLWLGTPRSVKMTSVKPSGTVSKLPGVSSGIHFPISDAYFQVIRFASSSPYPSAFRAAGYRVVDLDPAEPNTTAVYFGVIDETGCRGESEVSIWEQAEHAAKMQHYWADNQVSITVKYKPEERDQLPHLLRMYEDRLKAISFFPVSDHGFDHAPWQPASKETVQKYLDSLRPVNYAGEQKHELDDEFCSGETCLIK